VLFIGRVGLGFQFQTLGSVSEHLVDIFVFSYAEIGMLIGAFLLPGVVLALPSGIAGRYASDRLIVTTGLMFRALGGVVAVIATNFSMFGNRELGRRQLHHGGGRFYRILVNPEPKIYQSPVAPA